MNNKYDHSLPFVGIAISNRIFKVEPELRDAIMQIVKERDAFRLILQGNKERFHFMKPLIRLPRERLNEIEEQMTPGLVSKCIDYPLGEDSQ